MRVIVNADDFGLSDEVNAAIADAVARGLVTSVSVLGNGPALESGGARLREMRDVSVGVHLNVSEFAPLTPVPSMQGLLRDGQLCERSLELGREHADAVYEEWSAQVIRVRSFGMRLSHLDSHQHFHTRDELFNPLKRVQARFGIERVRSLAAWQPGLSVRSIAQRWRARRFARRIRTRAPEGFTTDGFGSARLFRELVRAGKLPTGTFEVMVHPGNPHDPAYAEEMAWLAGDWRRETGAEFVTWWDVG